MEEIAVSQENNLEESYNELLKYPLKILEVFKDYFGESRIDMQGYPTLDEYREMSNKPQYISDIFILIHFPTVKITNENNKFVVVNDLWVKVLIDTNGNMKDRFTICRSEYQKSHFRDGYVHSHVPSLEYSSLHTFKPPCLGSGPIYNTICTLRTIPGYDEPGYDENIWRLFCVELDNFMQVESLTGVPYKHLEKTGKGDLISLSCTHITPRFTSTEKMILCSFIDHFIKSKQLKFSYKNGVYSLGISYVQFIILISNEFIKWYNNQYNAGTYNYTYRGCSSGLLAEVVIENNRIYANSNYSDVDYTQYVGTPLFKFKNKTITLKIIDDYNASNTHKIIILTPVIIETIYNSIIKILNYTYGTDGKISEDTQCIL